jgi:predicted nucleotidyltransferase
VDVTACRRSFIAREERKQARRELRRQAALKAAINAIRDIVPGYPTVRRAYLFGSVLRHGAFRVKSDVDIAIEDVDAADFFSLWRDLEEAMPDWAVDLRDLVPGSHFARRVQERGRLIYERDASGIEGRYQRRPSGN